MPYTTNETNPEAQLTSASEVLLAASIKNFDVPYFISGTEGDIFSVNKASCKLFNYTEKEFRLLNRNQLFSSDKSDIQIISTKDEKEIFRYELTGIKKNNEKFPCELISSLSVDSNGNNQILNIIIDTSLEHQQKQKEEEERKHSDEQYRLLFFNSPFPACIYDAADYSFLELNDAALSLFGYKREQIGKVTLLDIIPGEDLVKLAAQLKKVATHPEPQTNVWRLKKRSGEIVFIESRSNSIPYKGKRGRLVIAQDITQKVLAEQELKHSNERYRIATKASFDAIWDADMLTDEVFFGEGFETLFGYKSGKVPGSTWSQHIHPDDKDRVLKQHFDILDNQPKQNFWSDQYRYLRADGSIAYVVDRGIIIRDKNGKPLRIVGAMQDITDEKLKEQELIHSNERFYYATQATSDIIWDWDLRTNHIKWAENFQKILGIQLPPDSTLPLEEYFTRIHHDDREMVTKSLGAAIESEKQKKWECEFRFKRGNETYAYVTDKGYIIRDRNGKAIRMIGAMHDNSEQKYNQDLLSLELRVFEISSTPGIPFKEVIDALLNGIETIHPQMLCSVILLTEKGTTKHLSGPSLPPEYLKQIDDIPIGPKVGSAGTAMYLKQPVIVSDIEHDPLWKDYASTASQYDLKACWAVPIIQNNGDVLGSFAIYYRQPKSPAEKEWDSILRIRNLVRLLIENNNSFEQIRVSNERFDIVTNATHDLIWDWNLDTNELYRDLKGLQKVYGFRNNEPLKNISGWLERIHPDDLLKVQRIISNILNATNENTFDVEYRFKREDGNYTYIYDRGYLLRNSDGKPYRMIGAAQDISERKKLEAELMLQQKAISQATINIQEKERSEIGKELHDNVNQVLTTTKLYLDLAKANPELKDELIEKSSKNIMNAIAEIRQLSRTLMVPSLGDLGLIDSIEDLVEDINATKKLFVIFDAKDFDEEKLNENQKVTIFRIVQEALNNIIRHAEATETNIELSSTEDAMKFTIRDNGKGFDIQAIRKGAGLNNIRNRVYLLNGTLIIDTHPGNGCTLIVDLPFVFIQPDA